MPTIGERKSSASLSRGYAKDPMASYAKAFRDVANDILQESGVQFFGEAGKAVMLESANDALKNFFIENSADTSNMSADELEDHMTMMEEQYLNDRNAILEYSSVGSFNPVIGLTFPLHKNILMNNIFDKGAIPKTVAKSPKFTLTMETRVLVTPDGREIDMFKQQNEMKAAIDSTAPFVKVPLLLPEVESVDVLDTYFNVSKATDNLSIETYVSDVLVQTYAHAGDTVVTVDDSQSDPTDVFTESVADADGNALVWMPVKLQFVPAYGEYDRQMMGKVSVSVTTADTTSGETVETTSAVSAVISGYMKDNMVMLQSSNADVRAVRLSARLDTSNAMVKTCSVRWKSTTTPVEIPSALPINIPVSPEEVKDVAALYNVNQLTKIMSMAKTVLGNYKDDKIKEHLDTSFLTMPEDSKLARTYDMAPREGYALDHVEWRHKTFMDALDTYVTNMVQVLNDPNVTVTVIGRPDIIRKLTPTEYTYQTPSSIGPVELDFVKTVTTSDKRVYSFISSDKLRGTNDLIVLLCPRNTERIIYMIYDYQMYVSNEIRNATNYALPAIHAFERWKFQEYQPVQARIKVLNPSGLRSKEENTQPISQSAMNDFLVDL